MRSSPSLASCSLSFEPLRRGDSATRSSRENQVSSTKGPKDNKKDASDGDDRCHAIKGASFARVAYSRYVTMMLGRARMRSSPSLASSSLSFEPLRRGYSASSLVPALSVGDLLGNEANAPTGTPASPYCLT